MAESKDATSIQQLASEILDAIEGLLPGDAAEGETGGERGRESRQHNPPYALLGHSMVGAPSCSCGGGTVSTEVKVV
jgi:hypothetical protein